MTPLRDLLAKYRAERGGSLAETVKGVQQLSPMFNGVIPFRPGYMAHRTPRRAYVNYYLPVNAAKVDRVLAELESYATLPDNPRVLDFGCGPGTASIALLQRRQVGELMLVDIVDEALDDASFFCRLLGTVPETRHEPPRDQRFDLILAANVRNEAARPLEDLIEDDGYLVVIEPALKATTQKLQEWRDDAVARGFKVAAPCLHRERCPMRDVDDLWCHQDVPWGRPSTVAEVDRRIGLRKETLKYAYLVLTRTGKTLGDGEGTHRVVSNLHRRKGKAWTWLCGREGPLCRAEMLTRHRGPETAPFFRATRGDVLQMAAQGPECRLEGPVKRALRVGVESLIEHRKTAPEARNVDS